MPVQLIGHETKKLDSLTLRDETGHEKTYHKGAQTDATSKVDVSAHVRPPQIYLMSGPLPDTIIVSIPQEAAVWGWLSEAAFEGNYLYTADPNKSGKAKGTA